MPAALMLHEVDPKEEIFERIGDISGVEVFGSDVLVALYMRPEKTKGGIILADATRDEDRWQGKVGIVLKLGATAYCDESGKKFRDIEVGDLVVFRPSDGWQVTLNSKKAGLSSREAAVPCRIVTDIHIRMRVSSPDEIY
jgi:co-chaperonin GroES (HSP10)